MTDPRSNIETLRDRISTSDELSDADREALLEFSDELYLRTSQYSDHRHEKLLRHCTIIAETVGSLADTLDSQDAAREIVRWINRTYDNEETNRDYRVSLRVFGRRVTDGDEIPDSIDWIPSGTSSNYDPAPRPGEMLHWDEHVVPMIDDAKNSRDRAMLAVAWDSGVRSGEFRSLAVGDVTTHKHGLQITVNGKTGQRSVTLIPSVPHLRKWLDDHPSGRDTDPLWTKLNDADDLSYRMFSKIFQRAADRADIDPPVTITNFRKSSASYLASQGMSQAHIEEHHGWTRGSTVAARYISVFGDAADNELARLHGLDISDDETDPIGPVTCPRCQRQTPRDEEFCVWCEQALSPGAVDQLRTDEREVQRAVLRFAKDNPDLLDAVEERHDIAQVLEDNPDLRRRAREFVEAVNEG